MGIADRDYMHERARAESRGAVFRPGTRHANPRRQKLLKAALVAVVIVGAGPLYHHLSTRPSTAPPPMRAAEPVAGQPALTPPVDTPIALDAPAAAQEFPASGTTQWYRPTSPQQQAGILRIMDTSDLRGNKVVRIRDAFGTPVAQTYIRFEEGAQLLLPLGRYEMTVATGDTWYGPQQQFGAAAIYYSTQGVDVIAGEVNYRILPANQGGQPLTPIQSEAF